MNDDRARAEAALAEAWEAAGRGALDAAREAFARAMLADSGFAPGWGGLGVVLGRMNRLDDAEAALRMAGSLAPDDAEYLFRLAEVLGARMAYGEAVELAMAAAHRRPEHVAGLELLADLLFAVRRYDDARAIAEHALRLDPRSAAARDLIRRHQVPLTLTLDSVLV